jgi:hypothetical protein
MDNDGLEQVKVRVLPDGRLSRSDAAIFLGRKVKTLAMWSSARRGPRVIRVGGRCFYHLDDLRRYVDGEAA